MGGNPALVTADRVLTYRDLNARANAFARHLMANGFRRGDRAVIALPASPELLIAELAVLKAGGAYLRPATRLPYTVTTPFSLLRDGIAFGINISGALDAPQAASPNLPVMVRETDPACVVADDTGALTVHVPHATIAAVGRRAATVEWDDVTPFDHWAALVSGGTLEVPGGDPLRIAA